MSDTTIFDPIAYINEPRWRSSRLGLERMRELLARLDNPQDKLRFVHVAGTNGKGSTCAYLASILQAAGYKCGLFTSPYIETFEERIRIDGKNISASDLLNVTLDVRTSSEQMADHPTEFELMCAVALLYFARQSCEIVVMEVGLGGRLDATNVIDAPEVCVIARIGLDHTDLLGETLAEIAREKAGIIKRGVAVVSYPQAPEAAQVIEDVCAQNKCALSVPDFSRLEVFPVEKAGFYTIQPTLTQPTLTQPTLTQPTPVFSAAVLKHVSRETFRPPVESVPYSEKITSDGGVVVLDSGEDAFDNGGGTPVEGEVFPDKKESAAQSPSLYRWFSYGEFRDLKTTLLGSYQPQNAALALEVVRVLQRKGWRISKDAVYKGIAQTNWPGRFEVVAANPTFIVDGGHNPQGACALAETLDDVLPGERVIFVMGVLADKDYASMIKTVLPYARAFITFAPPNPRALSAADLAQTIRSLVQEHIETREAAEGAEAAEDAEVTEPVEPAAPIESVVSVETTEAVEVAEGARELAIREAASTAQAIKCAREMAGADDVIVAFGSLYSIAALKAAL